jgi:hypothetical protein
VGLGILPTRNSLMGSCRFGHKCEPNGSLVKISLKLKFYDYIGNNPSKRGLLREVPLKNGKVIVLGWLGHSLFKYK